jgi:hypothetical protein
LSSTYATFLSAVRAAKASVRRFDWRDSDAQRRLFLFGRLREGAARGRRMGPARAVTCRRARSSGPASGCWSTRNAGSGNSGRSDGPGGDRQTSAASAAKRSRLGSPSSIAVRRLRVERYSRRLEEVCVRAAPRPSEEVRTRLRTPFFSRGCVRAPLVAEEWDPILCVCLFPDLEHLGQPRAFTTGCPLRDDV